MDYDGQSPFSTKQMNAIIGFRPETGLSSEGLPAGLNRLLGELNRAGCFLAELELEYSPDSTEAKVKITNGIIPSAGNIIITGNNYLGQSYLAGLLSARPKGTLSEGKILRDIAALSLVYADNGFPHARIAVGDFSLSGSRLDYSYQIEEGPRVNIDQIRFAGNVQTKDQALLRLSGLAPGVAFNRRNIEKGRARLIKSGLFRSVSEPMLTAGDRAGSENLLIAVEEGRYNNIFGAVGYNRDETRQNGWLTGSIDMAFSNLGGAGRRARISWQRLRQENSRLSAEFSTPWIFSLNMGLTAAVSHRIEDSTYTQSSGRMMADLPAGEHFTAGVGAEAVRVVPGSAQLIKRNIKYNSLWSLEADYRDGSLSPRGFLSKLEIEYGRKRYYDPSVQLTVSRVKLDAGQVQGIFSGQSISLAGHFRAVISSEQPVPRSDQFSMGGAASLRGYWEEQFIANQLAWGNLEYRYSPDRRLELFPFYDLGYYYDPERSQRGYRSGYGAGFRMDTALGWISLVYGLGRGDGWGQGKVHISLDSDF
ncbi:MAG: BamA/TamA family outer membrane protein [Candidatus Edwardsbacteria bacterium]|nr:BamA/TamA family outer membrane protein [Candidatus Edwardsbacteria bacterium]MBU1576532.1 BamA/TamA family outer membrane protein [Candidatus Edwardsbacteria bacterium]MBU2464379.1 BamA/TamA family outer membrane protein [Candidatus Edwardsbacteria bacterium]MBU2593689.1 BamA/TamA family outer membrane protein [Candidatus Edwardsbacteria bacterium]